MNQYTKLNSIIKARDQGIFPCSANHFSGINAHIIRLCFNVSTSAMATSTEIESVKYGLLLINILILGMVYLLGNQIEVHVTRLAHNDHYSNVSMG
jgi:hypothetical protein